MVVARKIDRVQQARNEHSPIRPPCEPLCPCDATSPDGGKWTLTYWGATRSCLKSGHTSGEARYREYLDAILDTLPDESRAVFVLVEIEGLSAPEVANVLGIPAGTVASRLRRARKLFTQAAKRLRARLEGGSR